MRCATPRIERAKIDAALALLLRHADAAAQIDDRDVRKMPRELREQRAGLGPVGDIENAAAGVRMQADDPHVRAPARGAASSSISASGTPNFECAPAVRTW